MCTFWLRRSILVAAFAALVPYGGVHAQGNGAAGWSITPYIWGTDTAVDLTFRDTDIGAGDISFNDLLDVLDTAFMI